MVIFSKMARAQWGREPFLYMGGTQEVPKDVVWVKVHPSVRKIRARAFAGCPLLEWVDFNKGLEEIGNNAFCDCPSLIFIRLPLTTRTIGAGAFSQCKAMMCVILNTGLEEIGNCSFSQCLALKYMYFPSTLNILGENSFEGCSSLEEVALNEGLSWVQKYAFHGCGNLKLVGIPQSIKRLGEVAIPATAKREYREPGELLKKVRDKVSQIEDNIMSKAENGKGSKSPSWNPIGAIATSKSAALAKTVSTEDDTKTKDNAKLAGQKASMDGAHACADNQEANNIKDALAFLRTQDTGTKLQVPTTKKGIHEVSRTAKNGLVESDTKKSTSAQDTDINENPDSQQSEIAPRVWEERIKALEATLKTKDEETEAKFLQFNDQILNLKRKLSLKISGIPINMGRELEQGNQKLSALERSLKTGQDKLMAQSSDAQSKLQDLKMDLQQLKSQTNRQGNAATIAASQSQKINADIQDLNSCMTTLAGRMTAFKGSTTIRNKEIQEKLQLVREENHQLKHDVCKQTHIVSTSTCDARRRDSDLRNLEGVVKRLRNETESIMALQEESQGQLSLAREEDRESRNIVNKKIDDISAVLTSMRDDAQTWERRVTSVECRTEKHHDGLARLETAMVAHHDLEKQGSKMLDDLAANVDTLSKATDGQIRTSEEKFDEISTSLENADRCLGVLKRCVELQLAKDRERSAESQAQELDGDGKGTKRPHEEMDDIPECAVGMICGLRKWTNSFLSRKKMKGQVDEVEEGA